MLATLPFPTTMTPQHPRFARKIDEYMKRHLEIKLISSIVTKAETV